MTRLTRAELVDLVRRLVESLGDGGLSRTLCIEAERSLEAEEEAVEEWASRGGSLYLRDTDRLLTVRPFSLERWHWFVEGMLPHDDGSGTLASGHASTEAEAQQAALDAARSLT